MQHPSATPSVFNQTPSLEEYNLFSTDLALQEAVHVRALVQPPTT